MKKRIYIAGPITKGDLASNVNQATAAFVAIAKAGMAPLCPHWSVYAKECVPAVNEDTQQLEEHEVWCLGCVKGNDQMTHADWIGIDLPWVAVADALLRLPGESKGADAEVAEAKRRGIPIFYSMFALMAWFVKVVA